MHLQLVRRYFQILRRVGDDIQMHRRIAAWVQIDALEILAGVDRRVNQIIECHRFERDRVARLRGRLQSRAELPAVRQRHAGCEGDVA
jgi:hypothetical protein